jgi:hypothetical protein
MTKYKILKISWQCEVSQISERLSFLGLYCINRHLSLTPHFSPEIAAYLVVVHCCKLSRKFRKMVRNALKEFIPGFSFSIFKLLAFDHSPSKSFWFGIAGDFFLTVHGGDEGGDG